jgi:hypothetical protein
MVVGSNGALGQLQELGGVATSRLQDLLGANGANLGELMGLSKIVNSAPVQAIVDIGSNLAGGLIERAAGGKELEALKEIGGFVLNKLVATVQGVAGQMSEGPGSSITSRFQDVSGLAKGMLENTGLANGFAKLAESAMGAISSARS